MWACAGHSPRYRAERLGCAPSPGARRSAPRTPSRSRFGGASRSDRERDRVAVRRVLPARSCAEARGPADGWRCEAPQSLSPDSSPSRGDHRLTAPVRSTWTRRRFLCGPRRDHLRGSALGVRRELLKLGLRPADKTDDDNPAAIHGVHAGCGQLNRDREAGQLRAARPQPFQTISPTRPRRMRSLVADRRDVYAVKACSR